MNEVFEKYLVKDAVELIKKVFIENANFLTMLIDAKFVGMEYSKTYKTLNELNAYGELAGSKLNGLMGFHCTRAFVNSSIAASGLTEDSSPDYESKENNLPSSILNDFILKAFPLFVALGYNFKYRPLTQIFGSGCNAAMDKELVSVSLKFVLEGHEVCVSFCIYIPELRDFAVVQNEFYVVPAFSIAESETVPFDVYLYLRTNNKLLKIFSANIAIDKGFRERVLKQKHDLLYIKKDGLMAYQEFVKEDIIKKMQDVKKINIDPANVTKEKQKEIITKFQSTVTGLFKTLVENPDVGKSLVDQCSTVIKDSIATLCNEKDFFKRINEIVAKYGTENSHYVNVSTFAIMFAIALEITDPVVLKELGMAATFHDIGKIKFPDEMKGKNAVVMNEQETEIYKQHPIYSVDMLKASKAKIGDLAYRMIIEHHESISGDGFPKGLKDKQIHPYSQILSIADTFENTICGFSTNKGLTPQEAMQKIINDNAVTDTPRYNHDILTTLFTKLTG